MSDLDPIYDIRSHTTGNRNKQTATQVTFDRKELNIILSVYGNRVASGDWRDYAIGFTRDKAIFSIYRRHSECPLYRIEKDPKLRRKQGAFSVVEQGGRILKRGHDLGQVLKVLAKKPKLTII